VTSANTSFIKIISPRAARASNRTWPARGSTVVVHSSTVMAGAGVTDTGALWRAARARTSRQVCRRRGASTQRNHRAPWSMGAPTWAAASSS
jgi:hypothetical protein